MGVSLNPSSILNGQGINVSSLVQQVLGESSGQLTEWQNEKATLQLQATDLTNINGDLNNLATAVQALSDPMGALTGLTATSSDTGVLTASAGSTATAGTHNIVVSSLATAGLIYSNDFAGGSSGSVLPTGATSGEIDLQIGGTNHPIVIDAANKNTTLSTLATYISGQNWGVKASVVTDSNGSRLALVSQSTGAASSLSIASNQVTGTLNTNSMASADDPILASGQDSGDIQLQIGGSSGTTADFQLTANDTLNTLAGSINSQSTANNWGITASVVQDSGGYHLSIVSSAQGQAGDLAITSNTNTTLTAQPNPATNLSFATPVGGTNAQLTVDGIPVSEASNSFTLPTDSAVTVNLNSASPGETVQLSVGASTDQITQAINNFVSAYNAVISDMNVQYTVDPTTNNEGPLGSDSSLRQLQSSLLSDAAFSTTGNGGYVNLASLGISTNDDGTLTVDSSQLASAISSNPSAVQNFFQNATSTGFANNFNKDLNNLTSPTTGLLNADLAQNSAQQQDLTTSINNFETQLTAEQTQLTNEYNSVNASLQEYPLLLQQVTETLATMGGSSDSNSSTSSPTLTSGL
jgi:flagellar hook-associated protein 2